MVAFRKALLILVLLCPTSANILGTLKPLGLKSGFHLLYSLSFWTCHRTAQSWKVGTPLQREQKYVFGVFSQTWEQIFAHLPKIMQVYASSSIKGRKWTHKIEFSFKMLERQNQSKPGFCFYTWSRQFFIKITELSLSTFATTGNIDSTTKICMQ